MHDSSNPRIERQQIQETLVWNAQRGRRYRVKLVDDPVVYEGIPVSKPGDTAIDEDAYRLEIESPTDHVGLVHGRIRDIEWLERL